MVAIAPYMASLVSGTTVGAVAGDTLGAIPVAANVPANSASAKPKVVSDGTPVASGATPSARESLWMSAAIVLAAMGLLVFGAKKLDGIRIG